MNSSPQTSELSAWRALRDTLSGSFEARAAGLAAREFSVRKKDLELGRLRIDRPQIAEFTSKELAIRVERTRTNEYQISSPGSRVLSAGPQAFSADALEITCAGKTYSSGISFLRNTATALNPAGDVVLRLTGNLTGRRYKAVMTEDIAALPISVLLLYHTVLWRRRAYLA